VRLVLIALIAVALIGCSRERVSKPTPTAPSVPAVPTVPPTVEPPARPPELTVVWVVVIPEGGGQCVAGATVEIVRGQGLGSRLKQDDSCTYWDPDFAATFKRLNAGEELTLRASAPGYLAKEITVVPTTGVQRAVVFELQKVR
jgi:hypothetical protein